jgi:hypothetical protein
MTLGIRVFVCARPPRHPRARDQKTCAMSHRPGLLVLGSIKQSSRFFEKKRRKKLF